MAKLIIWFPDADLTKCKPLNIIFTMNYVFIFIIFKFLK